MWGKRLGYLLMALSGFSIISCERVDPPFASPGPSTWSRLPETSYVAHPAGRFLSGRRIGIDPGHGAGRNPDREFEGRVNLQVALQLREFLQRDGAVALLTRDSNIEVPLAERPRSVEEQGAEVFVSIHHNATEDPEKNFTSTWYHQSPDKEPASLDLARAIQRGVLEALRTPLYANPLLTDSLMYGEKGFAVLRHARIPAVLCEASFFTHKEEQKRLENPEYLRREAYGYYLALVDYFSAGTPSLDLEAIQERSGEQGVELRLILDDGLNTRGGWRSRKVRILPSTIYCRVDGKSVPFHYDEEQARLSLTVPFLAEPSFTEAAEIVVRFQNLYKNSNFPSSFELRRDPHGNLKFASIDSSSRHKKMRY